METTKNKIDFSKSEEYRAVINNLIPGGAHTYSKGEDQFPLFAPAAISHGKGPYVWDLDGNKFLDGLMGLTSVSLGHAYEPVLERVREELLKGANFSRPSYIEREMAEKFLSVVPGHDMIKFGKNGSTVTSAAVKLARAHTGRQLIAVPHNHPFYSYDDWFIGTTACPRGVPDGIRKLSVTFEADNYDDLVRLFDEYPGQIAGIIQEPEKTNPLPADHLQKCIDLAHKHGAVYILDEMITGFKTHFPGSGAKFGVVPDLTTWGKGIANGFSFTCLTGKKEIMELGGIRDHGKEKVFLVSTTHGGETHGIAAGMATFDEFVKHDVVTHNQAIGDLFIQKTSEVIASKGMSNYVKNINFNWLPGFQYYNKEGEADLGMRTLLHQELVRGGVLWIGALCPTFTHTEADIDLICAALEPALDVYADALQDGYEKFLIGDAIKPVFRKWN